MIRYDGIKKSEIRNHYELATMFYRLLWGSHIHHGLWEGSESSFVAQRQLIDHLANIASIGEESEILDVGCGVGGSAIYLANKHRCKVTGLTLSKLQQQWANVSSWAKGQGQRTKFLCQDAEKAQFKDGSFDFLWSIECTEHLFDKQAFFQRAANWLRPGGKVALCNWTAGDHAYKEENERQIKAVCKAFLCPSIATEMDYRSWLQESGLEIICSHDLTPKITRTWEICQRRVSLSGLKKLSRLFGKNMQQFVDNFETLLQAYRTGAMKYCSMVALKPPMDRHTN